MKALKYNFFFLFLLICLFFSGCNNTGNSSKLETADIVATRIPYGDDELVVCDIAKVKNKINLPLSNFVSDFEIIRLENTEEALTRSGYTFISDNYIGIDALNLPYKLYDKKGKFICNIGGIGQGPFEYHLGNYDSYIDEEAGSIYLLPVMNNNIWVFDLSGTPKFAIPIPYQITKGRLKVDTKNRKLTIMNMPFPGTPSVIWQQDFEGNILSEIDAEPFIIDPADYSNEIGSEQCAEALDFHIDYYPGKQDSLYHYDESANYLQPVFTVNLTEESLKDQHVYTELRDYFIMFFCPTIERWEMPDTQIIVDKKTLRGAYYQVYNDFLGDIPCRITYNCSKKYFISNIYAHELKKQLEVVKASPCYLDLDNDMKRKLTDLYQSIGDDDNNIILIGKLK